MGEQVVDVQEQIGRVRNELAKLLEMMAGQEGVPLGIPGPHPTPIPPTFGGGCGIRAFNPPAPPTLGQLTPPLEQFLEWIRYFETIIRTAPRA